MTFNRIRPFVSQKVVTQELSVPESTVLGQINQCQLSKENEGSITHPSTSVLLGLMVVV